MITFLNKYTIIAPDKMFVFFFQPKYTDIYFSMKTYVMGTHQKCLGTSDEYPQHMFLWRNKNYITEQTHNVPTMSFQCQSCVFAWYVDTPTYLEL